MSSVEYIKFLKENVAPVLSEGLLLALRDQPHDPAAYMAEFLSSKGAATSVTHALHERQLADEYASLEAEMSELQAQLQAARTEARLRLPFGKPRALFMGNEEEEAMEMHAAASWHESLRLMRLMRGMKERLQQPLSASDWLLAEGVILACAAPGIQAAPLCENIARDFSAAYISAETGVAPLEGIVSPVDNSLLLVERTPESLLSDLAGLAGRPSAPTALLIFTAQAGTLAARSAAFEPGAIEANVQGWLSDTVPALEREARGAGLRVLYVHCDGDRADQMTNLLCALVAG